MNNQYSILRIKHWQIFAPLVGCVFLFDFIKGFIAGFLNLEPYSPATTIFELVVTIALLLSYPLVLAKKLDELLINESLFVSRTPETLKADCLLFVMPYIAAQFLDRNYMWLEVLLTIVSLTGLIRIVAYPARQLRSIELRRNAGIWEYTSEAFQILFWPVGIWWIQPRINAIETKQIGITE